MPKAIDNIPKPPTPSPLAGIKKIILVGSGKGGVGKSTIAVNIALAFARAGYKTGLVDADIHGPSVAKMLNIKEEPKVEGNKIIPPEKFGVKAMSMGFLVGEDAALVWRGPMISKALYQLLRAANWGELDFLVIDMPPGTGDIHLSIVQNFTVDGAVIASTPQEVALLDVKKCINMLKKVGVPILGLVENMSYFSDSSGAKNYIFGKPKAAELAKAINSELLAEIPLEPKISESSDKGEPVSGEIGKIFDSIAQNLAAKLINKS